jgi:hypothetical protein
MDPKLIVIVASLLVAAIGYLCLAPEQFGFLRLPASFAALGLERVVTGLALMLLGFIAALSELQGEPHRRRARPLAFQDDLAQDDLVLPEGLGDRPAPGLVFAEPEPQATPDAPKRDAPAMPAGEARAAETPPEP